MAGRGVRGMGIGYMVNFRGLGSLERGGMRAFRFICNGAFCAIANEKQSSAPRSSPEPRQLPSRGRPAHLPGDHRG